MIDQFSQTIEQMASDNGGSYIEALVDFANKNHLEEFEELVELLHINVYDKVKAEFRAKNYIRDDKIENDITDFFK